MGHGQPVVGLAVFNTTDIRAFELASVQWLNGMKQVTRRLLKGKGLN
jgi:hypothetical protein